MIRDEECAGDGEETKEGNRRGEEQECGYDAVDALANLK